MLLMIIIFLLCVGFAIFSFVEGAFIQGFILLVLALIVGILISFIDRKNNTGQI